MSNARNFQVKNFYCRDFSYADVFDHFKADMYGNLIELWSDSIEF